MTKLNNLPEELKKYKSLFENQGELRQIFTSARHAFFLERSREEKKRNKLK